MNVACPECRSVFRVDPAKVVGVNLRARCAVCGGIIPVGASVRWSDDFGASAAASHVRQPEQPRAPAVPTAVPAALSSAMESATAVMDRTAGTTAPARPRVAVPTAPAADLAAVARPAPTAAPPTLPLARAATPVPAATTVSTPRPADAASPARRPINPFLANDPNTKARRLARALVSDMIAYHPRKRDEGLRDGTLKQLFREEIKKSYEEYSEQVGREFAESTSHFQDALNEVLAGGRKLF